VMVGRAHYGAPWMAGAIAAEAAGTEVDGVPASAVELGEYVLAHYEDMLSLYGIESGLRQARKHIGWYFDRHAPATPAELRRTAMTSFEPASVMQAIREAFGLHGVVPAMQYEQTRKAA
jgi:tRNA-dihydrouridine synthase B